MIYVIQADVGGPVKIGYTSSTADARLRALQCGSPFRLVVIATDPDGTTMDESELHKRFAVSRLHGEWFALTDEMVVWIAKLRREVEPFARSFVPWKDGLSPELTFGSGWIRSGTSEPSPSLR